MMSVPSHPVARTIEEAYRQRTPRSAEHHRRAQQFLPGGDSRTVTHFEPHPLYIEMGEGQRMTDADGNVYLDFLGNYTSMIHGHGQPALAGAIAKQVSVGTGYAAPSPAQIALAEELCRRVHSVDKVRFCNSGTEATMNAIRAARAFTGRDKLLKMEGGYHGSHDWAEVSVSPALTATGPLDVPKAAADEPGIPDAVVEDVVVVPFNDFEAASAVFDEQGNDIAAVIIEPVMGASGTIPAEDGYLNHLRQLCDQHGALLIFDEVITLRLNEGGAQALYDVTPDLTTFGKIIGGGLPVGGFGGRDEVMALYAPPGQRMVQSGTFNANPATMAAGLVSLQLLTPDEIARINQLGARLATGLQTALDEMGVAGQVTGLGSLQSLHFTDQPVTDYRGMATSDAGVQRLTHLSLLNQGIFAAKRGMFVISTPMGEADVEACVSAFAGTLGELRPYIADEAPHLLV